MSKRKTQTQLYYDAVHRHGQQDEAFMDLVRDHDLSNDELSSLINKRPERYSRYKGFVGKLKC